jgi:adenylosuccinate synthase
MLGNSKIGSTLKGIGPTYTDKTARNGIRIGDINLPNFKQKYNNSTDSDWIGSQSDQNLFVKQIYILNSVISFIKK